ncbi:MAG: hypothetical protein E6J29_13505 [Chloroflexi bacterium]|nr:MAG: hypothetical protein E6J29_13505 [Chloroflexota bacterium]TMD50719.1 MAG: hypothetical protein E6I85_15000 [Chloroflexota bacterium]
MGFRTNKLLVVGVLGVSALALIGLGAGAAFTDSVSGTQVINTGTLCAKISSVDQNGNPDGLVSTDGKSITFKAGPYSQISSKHMIFVTNDCSLNLNVSGLTLFESGGGYSPAPLGNDVTLDMANYTRSVRNLEGNWTCSGCQLAPGQTLGLNGDPGLRWEYTANLGNADEGFSISPTVTFNIVEWPGPLGPAGAATTAPA